MVNEERAAINRTEGKPRVVWLIAAVGLQVLLLAGMGVPTAYTLQTGQLITVHASPVDPHDIFRGEYVNLNYDIERIPCKKSFKQGTRVYVVLKKGQPYWTAIDVTEKKPQAAPNTVSLKAKVTYSYRNNTDVEYGVNKYFVAEGVSKNLEHQRKNLAVRLAVDSLGNLAIKDVTY